MMATHGEQPGMSVRSKRDATPDLQGTGVLEAFSRIVVEYPANLAIVANGQAISFAELDDRSDAMSRSLRGNGVVSGTIVGVHLPRSVDFIVGILAALKCGCAYSPFDPAQAPQAVSNLLRGIGCSHVVSAATGAYGDCITVVPPCGAGMTRTAELEHPGRPPSRHEDLLYVIFTSGSTGAPKGVAVSHRNILNFAGWARDVQSLTVGERATFLHGLGFDFCHGELWAYLCAGVTIVLPPSEDTKVEARALADWIRREQINIVFLITYLAERFLATPEARALPSVRMLITGGEALSGEAVDTYPFRFCNAYGPTETTVMSTFAFLDPRVDAVCPALGQPLWNTGIYVLDDDGMPVPEGGSGELHIGGAGVTWGYWKAPAVTAEKFLPDPFADRPGSRMYRTGDRVRSVQGRLEYLGRMDDEVKIEGVRVHPLLIDNALMEMPQVEKAVTVLRRIDKTHALEAYVLVHGDSRVGIDDIRAHLAQSLIHRALVPATIEFVADFPRKPNGKIDRGALAERPALYVVKRAGPVIEDLDETEQGVRTLYETVLKCEVSDVTAPFFNLGGSSRKALQLVSSLRKHFGVDLSFREFLDHSSIRDCACIVKGRVQVDKAGRGSVTGEVGPNVVSRFQESLFLAALGAGPSSAYNINLLFRVTGPLNLAHLDQAARKILERHEVLRWNFRLADDGEVVSRTVAVPARAVTEVQGSRSSSVRDVGGLLERPFSFEEEPLYRFSAIRESDDVILLAFSFHHIVFDASSAQVFLRELELLYAAVRAGDAIDLGLPAARSFSEVCARERRDLAGELHDARRFWVDALHSYRRPGMRRPGQSAPGVSDVATVKSVVARREALEDSCSALNTSVFSVVLAAYVWAIASVTGEADNIIGVVVNARTSLEMEREIGPYVNILPVRFELPAALDWDSCAIIGLVRGTLFAAIENMGVPYPQIMDDLAATPDAASPRIEFSYTHQDEGTMSLTLPDCTCEPVQLERRDGKFPVQLFAHPVGARLELTLRFDPRVFTADSARSVLACMTAVLSQVASRHEDFSQRTMK